LSRLKNISKELQFTTSINVSEIYYGACRSEHKEKILKAFQENVFPNINILPFDTESGKVYGEIRARLEKKGVGISEPDLRIAAIARQHKLLVISGNIKHFKNIPGLKAENWIR
jgi:tRNA(fMet)-specific endonuclease VapC